MSAPNRRPTDRHVVITGASSGFGWAMTEKFLRDGWTVHATSRSGELPRALDLASDVKSRLHVHQLDLTVKESRERFLAALESGVPTLDVLVNNAGFGLFGALEDLAEDQIRREMEVNFTGAVLVTQALLPKLRAARGHVINLSSVLGYSALPLTGLYCASKFALEGWSEALRYELGSAGVKVTVVQPGAHRTQFGFNVEWGKHSFSNSSPYLTASHGYRALLERMRTRPNPAQPDAVASRIVAIAGSAKPPFRLRIGTDAQATYVLRRLLPLGLMLKISDRVYRRLFLQAAPTR